MHYAYIGHTNLGLYNPTSGYVTFYHNVLTTKYTHVYAYTTVHGTYPSREDRIAAMPVSRGGFGASKQAGAWAVAKTPSPVSTTSAISHGGFGKTSSATISTTFKHTSGFGHYNNNPSLGHSSSFHSSGSFGRGT